MTNLVTLVGADYPQQYRCDCGVIVRELDGRWLDNGGNHWCWHGRTAHIGTDMRAVSPVVTASPLLRLVGLRGFGGAGR